MYKLYFKDIFTEGLGDIFFMKYYRFLKSKIKSKILYNILLTVHVISYIMFIIFVLLLLFKISYPL